MSKKWSAAWTKIKDTLDEHKQREDQRFNESNHSKSLKEMFAEK